MKEQTPIAGDFADKIRNRFRNTYLVRNAQLFWLPAFNAAITFFLFAGLGLVIYDFGFRPFWSNSKSINTWMQLVLDVLSILLAVRLFLELFITKKKWTRTLNVISWLFALFLTLYVLPEKSSLTYYETNKFLFLKLVLYTGIILGFITEASYLLQAIYSRTVNPALLFVGSFAFLILLGMFMLKLPNATYAGISVLDAFFTSTSAVCVTGLIVVDTATYFTTFGQVVILVLIQVGGLGIMTFAGLLAYAVAGQSSLRSQLAFRDMMSSEKINNVMQFVYQVVGVTLLFEMAGALCIYSSLSDDLFVRRLDKIFFSIFHSVSAFCNAGFSTYTNGLYEPEVRFNYLVQFFIALLIIFGGMGFPIVFNLYRYIRIKLSNWIGILTRSPKREYYPRVINLNARLAIVVSGVLLLIGFITYFIFEQSATLKSHPTWGGKLITSFFGSVTPRTAGFNTVDVTRLSLPTIMIYMLLMWIGTSPGSTGGGIRTTTAGLAFLNMAAILRGKDRTEFYKSEISHQSVRRAFAIVFLSFMAIGLSIFFITINDSDKGVIKIAFESFSAFSTVGLSLGITPLLSSTSKIVLIFTMFTGRVGMITLLVAFIRQSKPLYYRYPKEEITF